jgi:hypothetical protein
LRRSSCSSIGLSSFLALRFDLGSPFTVRIWLSICVMKSSASKMTALSESFCAESWVVSASCSAVTACRLSARARSARSEQATVAAASGTSANWATVESRLGRARRRFCMRALLNVLW